jgi:enoyl-CoA hydratase/carnithine racemase
MPQSAEDSVQVEYRSDRIAIVTLSRPHVLNALDRATVRRLRELWRSLDNNARIDVIVLTGSGERAFCTGADLKERKTLSNEDARTLVREEMLPMFREFDQRAKPAIAAVFGHVVGGGFELALCCDFIVAATDSQFSFPEVKWGILPAASGVRKLPGLIGPMRARAVILAGEKLSADDAHRLGLAWRIVPRDDLLASALELAGRITAGSPFAVQAARRCIEDAVAAQAATEFDLMTAQECYVHGNPAADMQAFGSR